MKDSADQHGASCLAWSAFWTAVSGFPALVCCVSLTDQKASGQTAGTFDLIVQKQAHEGSYSKYVLLLKASHYTWEAALPFNVSNVSLPFVLISHSPSAWAA